MTSTNTGTALSTFPHPELTRIIGAPTYLTLQQTRRELMANAISVHSIRGNGLLGHVVIVIGINAYNLLANPAPVGGNANNWTMPTHPGQAPNYPAGANSNQIARANATYDRELKEFITYNETVNALKKQLLAAVDPTYICSLQDPLYGYANLTVQAILEHLDATYGTLDQTQLNKNMATLDAPWTPTESMEPLWRTAVIAQQVAQAGNDPITDATLLRKFHKVLTDSGVFTLDLRDWDKKAAVDRTWPNFKTHFTAANKERIKNATAGDLHSAHSALGQHSRRSPTPTAEGATLQVPTPTSWSYCWTHGYGKSTDHNSRTCNNKATGHQEDATVENMMGGNNTIRRKRGERNKFRQLNPQQPRNPQQPQQPQQPRNANNANNANADNNNDADADDNGSQE